MNGIAPGGEAEPEARWLRGIPATLPPADPDAIVGAVLDWGVDAVGNRPEDHMARDLMHAAWLRDGRMAMFRRLTREPEPWVERRVDGLSGWRRGAMIRHTVLEQLHRRQLGQLADDLGPIDPVDVPYLGNGERHGLLMSLHACRPLGAELRWEGAGPRPVDFTCEYARLCPWCHARKVVALHDRLVAPLRGIGPLDPGPACPERMAGMHFLRLRLRLPGFKLAFHEDFVHFARRHGYLKRCWPWRSWDDDREYGPRGEVIRAGLSGRDGQDKLAIEARLVVRFWGRMMREHAAIRGAVGGVVTYQVEPYADNDCREVGDPLGFRHELNLVAAVPASAGRRIAEEHREVQYVEFRFMPGRSDGADRKYRDSEPVLAELVSGDTPHAVRHLLAGTGYRFESRRAVTWDNGVGRHAGAGVDGALRPMPWMLANPEQWWEHQQATRGLPLYRAFGTWARRRIRPMTEAAREARMAPMRARNHVRADAALGRRARLLEVARLVPGVAALGWCPLREELARLGHDVSVRDARDVSRALKDGAA